MAGTKQSKFLRAWMAANPVVEQLPSVDTWGKRFVTVPLATRLNGDRFRFLAAHDGTEVRVDGVLVATLNRGQFHERILPRPRRSLRRSRFSLPNSLTARLSMASRAIP